MKITEIKHFHPSGKPMPNGSHFQRGGFLHECRVNKDGFTLWKAPWDCVPREA